MSKSAARPFRVRNGKAALSSARPRKSAGLQERGGDSSKSTKITHTPGQRQRDSGAAEQNSRGSRSHAATASNESRAKPATTTTTTKRRPATSVLDESM